MPFPSSYDPEVSQQFLARLEKLEVDTQPQWGKMDAGQMLAHLNVAYEVTYGHTPVKYNGFMKLMLKLFVKKVVVGEKPYKKNSRTAPIFLIADQRDFEMEKKKLVAFIKETQEKGASYFEGRESPSFGVMTAVEWSNQFSKHLEHHFSQFGI